MSNYVKKKFFFKKGGGIGREVLMYVIHTHTHTVPKLYAELIWFKDWSYLISAAVGQVEFSLLSAEVHARLFAHHFGVNGFVRLHADHKLIPLALRVKDVPRNISELQPHFSLPLIQGFTTAQNKRDPYTQKERTGRERKIEKETKEKI